ncbi:MAG: hypothetical protein ACOCQD_00420 [archaeon]
MQIWELIEFAEDLQERIDSGEITGEEEVKLATQPHWPLEHEISHIEFFDKKTLEDIYKGTVDDVEELDEEKDFKEILGKNNGVVYIYEGTVSYPNPYLSKIIKEAVDWWY